MRYFREECPKCGLMMQPSKLEEGKWICKECNEVFLEDDLK